MTTDRPSIKLMPDYGCYPLWWNTPDKAGDIDPATLPLSQQTIDRLSQWAESYDNRLNLDDPANSPAPTDEEIEAFDREGRSIWVQLQEELPGYEVSYFNPDDRQSS